MNLRREVGPLSLFLALLAALLLHRAEAVPVDMELMLLSDISVSVDINDYILQRDGYEDAFRHPQVISAITSSGPIAVTWVLWAGEQEQVVPWTFVADASDSHAFADAVAAVGRPWLLNQTGLADGLDFGASLFADNGFEGQRLVIDVAGDGSESVHNNYADPISLAVQAARDNALNALDVTSINALWIENHPYFGLNPGDTINALDYGATNVIGGVNAFQIVVDDFEDFGPAITSKVLGEMHNGPTVPEPMSALLLAIGFAGLLAARAVRRA